MNTTSNGMDEIIPAIMPQNLDEVAEKVAIIADKVETIQLDIMDGLFVPQKTWPYKPGGRESLDQLLSEDTGLPLWDQVQYEFDLMVQKPEVLADELIRAGADRIIFHIETLEHPEVIIKKIRDQYGMPKETATSVEIGIAISLPSSLSLLDPLIPLVDFVQIMGIDPIGVQGALLKDEATRRVSELRSKYPELILSVDGGVKLENAKTLVDAGANRLVSGSAIFENENPRDIIDQFLLI